MGEVGLGRKMKSPVLDGLNLRCLLDICAACQRRSHKRCGFDPWVRKLPLRKAWQPTLVFLPGESHGQRSLVGYSP